MKCNLKNIAFIATTMLFLLPRDLVAQRTGQCGVPIHVSADSLVKYVRLVSDKDFQGFNKADSNFRKYNYSDSWGGRLDTAFAKCQDYLIESLGEDVYCKSIELKTLSFRKVGTKGFTLTFNFNIPGSKQIVQDASERKREQYEQLFLQFNIKIDSTNALKITYPRNLPKCIGLPDCGFISRQKAIDIAKAKGFIADSDVYWLSIDKNGKEWTITKTVVIHKEYDRATINLRTGELKHPVEEEKKK